MLPASAALSAYRFAEFKFEICAEVSVENCVALSIVSELDESPAICILVSDKTSEVLTCPHWPLFKALIWFVSNPATWTVESAPICDVVNPAT